MYNGSMDFQWDEAKNQANIAKHGVSFEEAKLAFDDLKFKVALDTKHSTAAEKRYFVYGDTGRGVLTVRFTIRNGNIRIIGAGYWRIGRKEYEQG